MQKLIYLQHLYLELQISNQKGQMGLMTPFVWMFISSCEKLRLFLIDQKLLLH